jgi:hypothetical protein
LTNSDAQGMLKRFLAKPGLSNQIPADVYSLLLTFEMELQNKEYEV